MSAPSIAAQDALNVYRIATRNQPCPICKGRECDHTVRERLLAELAGDQASSPRNDMAGLQRLAENVKRGGPTQVGVTPAQRRLHDGIKAFIAENGFSPTFTEMMPMAGVKSKSSINRLITGLKERGHVKFQPGKNRSIVIVGEQL